VGGSAIVIVVAVIVVVLSQERFRLLDSSDAAAAVASSAASDQSRVRAEGRVVTYAGGQVELGTELGGTIKKLHVHEGDKVKKDDLLVEFDDTALRAEREEARAAVHANNARAGFHVKETRRLEVLKDHGAIPQRELDRVRSERNASFGDTAVALSAVKRIDASLAKMILRAPIDGTVISCSVEQGETRAPGASILTIADLEHLRVEAEVDEYDVARVAVGARAIISAEGFEETWEGVVQDVPGALVPKGLKPRDPSRPVDIRVLLVKIGFIGPIPLKLGQRVEVRILGERAQQTSGVAGSLKTPSAVLQDGGAPP
jgi:RND family efflux transporter MFP subunit